MGKCSEPTSSTSPFLEPELGMARFGDGAARHGSPALTAENSTMSDNLRAARIESLHKAETEQD